MADAIMYGDESHFVVLESDAPETILTAGELRAKLAAILRDREEDLPRDLQRFESLDDRLDYLLDSACDLEMGPGQFLQWYVVRLEK